MKERSNYYAPESELVEIAVEARFLETSVGTTTTEQLNAINGSWDAE